MQSVRMMSPFTTILLSMLFIINAISSVATFEITEEDLTYLDKTLYVTPFLGRGYSINTRQLQNTCLEFDYINSTEASCSYEYFTTDFTKDTANEVLLQRGERISNTFGYERVKEEVLGSFIRPKMLKRYHIVVTMRRKCHHSLNGEHQFISTEARSFLEKEDYASFYLECGPNYIRSIRRAQEVTAIFRFDALDKESAQEFAALVLPSVNFTSTVGSFEREYYHEGALPSIYNDARQRVIQTSLGVDILTFGLNLEEIESKNMVATSLTNYNNVMNFAFDSMIKDPDEVRSSQMHLGRIYGMKVIPWVENRLFQTALVSPIKDPKRRLNLSPLIKKTIQENSEFTVELDEILHSKMESLYSLRNLVNKLPIRSPINISKHVTHTTGGVLESKSFTMKNTVSEPARDFNDFWLMTRELDEYIEMYYNPCMENLNDKNTLLQHTAISWYTLHECVQALCGLNRTEGGSCSILKDLEQNGNKFDEELEILQMWNSSESPMVC